MQEKEIPTLYLHPNNTMGLEKESRERKKMKRGVSFCVIRLPTLASHKGGKGE